MCARTVVPFGTGMRKSSIVPVSGRTKDRTVRHTCCRIESLDDGTLAPERNHTPDAEAESARLTGLWCEEDWHAHAHRQLGAYLLA